MSIARHRCCCCLPLKSETLEFLRMSTPVKIAADVGRLIGEREVSDMRSLCHINFIAVDRARALTVLCTNDNGWCPYSSYDCFDLRFI